MEKIFRFVQSHGNEVTQELWWVWLIMLVFSFCQIGASSWGMRESRRADKLQDQVRGDGKKVYSPMPVSWIVVLFASVVQLLVFVILLVGSAISQYF